MSTDKHYNKGMAFVKGVIVGVIKDIDPWSISVIPTWNLLDDFNDSQLL